MTTDERMLVAETFIKAVRKRMLVIVHVGHSSIAEAKLLSAHAMDAGADAFSSVAAFYFKPSGVQNLAESMAEIAAAAPELPFYYYHIPHLTGVHMDMIDFLEKAAPLIPNLAGIKYTATTLHEFQACLAYDNSRFDILYGLDEMLLPALAVGAKGAIGSTYTFAAPLYIKTMQLYQDGNIAAAQKNHLYMVEVIRKLVKYPPIPGQRAIMKMLGWDHGSSRLPLVTLNQDSYNNFFRDLDSIDFFGKVTVHEKMRF